MVKEALILAFDEKGLQWVFGAPAVRRLVLILSGMGFEAVHVLGDRTSLAPVLSDMVSPENLHDVGNPARLNEVLKGLDFSDQDRILVLRGNHVVDRGSLARFVQTADGPGLSSLEAEGSGNGSGIFVVGKEELPDLVCDLSSKDREDSAIPDRGRLKADPPGLPYLVGPGFESVRAAERGLVAALAAMTAKTDGFMARLFDRRLSRLISRRVARTPLTPNAVTLFNVALGFAGAFLFSRAGYWAHLAGSIIFLLCVILDGVDGEVARLKLQETVFGRYLDIITDNIVHVALFVGIGLGVARQTGDGQYLYVLGVLLGGFAFCAVVVARAFRSGGNGTRSETLDRLTGLLANRDFAYLLVIFALLDALKWFLVCTAAGTYLFAACVFFLDLRRKKVPSPR